MRSIVNPLDDGDDDLEERSDIASFDYKVGCPITKQVLECFLSYTFNEYSSVNLFNLPKKPVKLFDVFVSTATNYYLDVDIKDKAVQNVRVFSEKGYIPETYIGANKNEECDDAQKSSIINKITEHICASDEYYYPDKSKRPLILSAPYADGIKKKYWALNTFDVISLYDKVVVLGSPGTGKSTALRYIALELIANVCEKIDGDIRGSLEYLSSELFTKKYVPIYIEFGKLTKWFSRTEVCELSFENIVKYINSCCEEYSRSKEYVEISSSDFVFDSDNLLFIFDGIDEISQSNNIAELFSGESLTKLVDEIKRKYPHSRMLFSSRIGEYSSYQLKDFSVCSLIDMSEMLSIQLAKKVGTVLKSDGNFDSLELINTMRDKGLKADIIGNPMLLTLYTAVFIKNESGDSLVNRAQILREGIDLLLERWSDNEESKPEIMKKLDDPEKRDALCVRLEKLAYMQQDDVMDEKELMRFLLDDKENKNLLDYLASRVGLIVPLDQYKYKFAHKSFHSYLVARYIISKDDKIKELLLENIEKKLETSHEATGLVIDLLFDRISEPKYMDYLCGIVNDLLDDINIKSHYCVWFAAQILLRRNADLLNYFSSHHSGVIIKLKSALLEGFRNMDFPSDKRIECGRFLGALGDIRSGVDSFRDEAGVDLPEIVWCKVPYGGLKMGIDDATVKAIKDMNWGKNIDFSREKRSDGREVCVEIGEFEIGKYPITVAQFIPFLDDVNGYNNENWYSWSANAKEYFQSRNKSIDHAKLRNVNECFHGMLLPADYRTHNMPITHVHFYDAVAYCKWLSSLTGDSIRLPSEMEWEYLAKTLCSVADHKIFLWAVNYSSGWDDRFVTGECNCLESKIGEICPVGAFRDTDDAVPVDLIGNAWEWTQSVFSSTLDPIHGNMLICTDGDPIEDKMNRNTLIAVRGGSLHNGFNCMRVSFRGRDPLGGDAKDRHSFRIVRKKMNYLQQNYEMEHFNREDKRSFSKTSSVQYGVHECKIEAEEGYGAQVQLGNTITIMYNVKKNGECIDQQDAVSFVIGNWVVHKFIEGELLKHKVACNLTFSNVSGEMLFENGYANRIEKSDSLTIWIHIKDIQES